MRTLKQEVIIDGFSSEEQFKQQQIFVYEKVPDLVSKHKQQIKFIVPPAPEIKDKKKLYSLEPDMFTGWIPKMTLPTLVPLVYENYTLDLIIRELLKKPKQIQYKITYLGSRYENSYYAHYGKNYPFPYTHIKAPETFRFTNRQFLGNSTDFGDLKFNSLFQSGNLDCAIKVAEFEYDLFIQVDSNTKGHMQWYNFKITDGKKGTKYKFNICNFQKCKSLYSRGMKPYIFSKKRWQITKIGWQQTGENLKYDQKSFRYKFLFDFDFQRFHKLSFQYTFQYQNDQIQVAYCIPYQYSTLLNFIDELIAKSNRPNNQFIKISKLCSSLGALDVPLLTIHQTEYNQKEKIKKQSNFRTYKSNVILNHLQNDQYTIKKKCIIISGRAHPGQSNGSFMMQGFLEFICGNSPQAVFLRRRVIFKVIPMLNPDGVVIGNYRTGLSGKDFNREFLNPDKTIFPEIYYLKQLVVSAKHQFKNDLLLFLDFHGHSVKKNVFMYGPEFLITERLYYEAKIFPKLLSENSEMFRYYSCIFKISSYKQTTARAILLKKLDIPFTYTIEASNGSYYDKNELKDVMFNDKLWIQMGRKIGITLHQYCKLLLQIEETRIQKMRQRHQLLNAKKKIKTQSDVRKKIKLLVNINNAKFQTSPQKLISQDRFEGIRISQGQSSPFLSLVQQIKKQDQLAKQREILSDDAISQGSSDGQKQLDDLSPDKLKKIYKSIKNKRNTNVENCKIETKKNLEQEFIKEKIRFYQQTQDQKLIEKQKFKEKERQKIILKREFQQKQSEEFKFKEAYIRLAISKTKEQLETKKSFDEDITSELYGPKIQGYSTNRYRTNIKNKFSNTNSRFMSRPDHNQSSKYKPIIKIKNICFLSPFLGEVKLLSTPNQNIKKQINNSKNTDLSLKNTSSSKQKNNECLSVQKTIPSRFQRNSFNQREEIRIKTKQSQRNSLHETSIYLGK